MMSYLVVESSRQEMCIPFVSAVIQSGIHLHFCPIIVEKSDYEEGEVRGGRHKVNGMKMREGMVLN